MNQNFYTAEPGGHWTDHEERDEPTELGSLEDLMAALTRMRAEPGARWVDVVQGQTQLWVRGPDGRERGVVSLWGPSESWELLVADYLGGNDRDLPKDILRRLEEIAEND